MLAPAALTVVAVLAYPVVQTYRLSLTNAKIAEGQFIGLRNYRQLFEDPLFWVSIKNNLTLNLGITYTYYGQPANLFHTLTVKNQSGSNPL